MAEVSAEPVPESSAERPYRPWTQRLIAALPVAPAWVGLGLAAGHLLLAFTLLNLLADFAPGTGPLERFWNEEGANTVVFALLIGFAPAALACSRRAQVQAFHQLAPSLGLSAAERERCEQDLLRYDARVLRLVGGGVALLSVLITAFDPGIPRTRPLGDPVVVWNLWQNGLAGWLCARTTVQELRASWIFSHLGRLHTELRLLDTSPLTAFSRRGVQGALVLILMISLFSLIFLDDNAANVAPLVQLLVVILAGVAFLLPAWGVHERLRDRKRQALAEIAAEIRELEPASWDGEQSAAPRDAAARLSALLALREHVRSAREWPFNLSALVRLAVVVAIGLLSSLGQVILERVVGPLLP